jgi:hypothetical protein
MYDKWDVEESARKEAGRKFHYYWQQIYWMRSHMTYFFIWLAIATFALIEIPSVPSGVIYIAEFGAPFGWGGILFYYAYMMRLSYNRWGGFDGGGGRAPRTPPSSGESPEMYPNQRMTP